MDALYAHISDIEEILQRKADYIVGIKGNQGILEAEAHNFFEQAHAINYEDVPVTRSSSLEKRNGIYSHRLKCDQNKRSKRKRNNQSDYPLDTRSLEY